ncbi:hypothetical protein GDO81_000239 [Engystomops pustulosus]|uniref:Uncharacterized protein n=1 Tax=Engystomops pustulosus TaxID=76066 RepID=A0AAV7D4Q5_ENGPU|nr:hypothetical protein GDO81_000239 [Engystomops pustulosus]
MSLKEKEHLLTPLLLSRCFVIQSLTPIRSCRRSQDHLHPIPFSNAHNSLCCPLFCVVPSCDQEETGPIIPQIFQLEAEMEVME